MGQFSVGVNSAWRAVRQSRAPRTAAAPAACALYATVLQRTCEAVLGRLLDKSVFRRRLKDSEDLVEVSGEFVVGSQRPAQLYRARDGFVF